MSELKCPVCDAGLEFNGKTPKTLSTGDGKIYACPSCGQLVIRRKYGMASSVALEMEERSSPGLKYDWLMKWISPHIIMGRKNFRVLDIGCWDGELLMQFPENFECYGVELNENAANKAKMRGIDVYHCKLEALPKNIGQFDIIIMLDVLEHLDDPVGAINAISDFLSPSGVFLGLTGNSESMCAKLYGKNWYYINYPEHVSVFSPRSIEILFDTYGIDIMEIMKVSHYSSSIFRTAKKIFSRFLGRYDVKVAGLPSPESLASKILVALSRVLHGRDHMVIVAKKKC